MRPGVATRGLILGGLAATVALACTSAPFRAAGMGGRAAETAQTTFQVVAAFAAAAHVGEAAYARRLAKRVDPDRTDEWTWTVFLYGIFSLRFLLAKRGEKACGD